MKAKEILKIKTLPTEVVERLTKYFELMARLRKEDDFPQVKDEKGAIDLFNTLITNDKKNAEAKAKKAAIKNKETEFLNYCKSMKQYGITLDDIKDMLKSKIKIQQKAEYQAQIDALMEKMKKLDD